ncbi:MAG TPA: hypothetical protein VGF13_19320 [Verrucomicrobiae bacterium]|jgi:hypothetical protein
MPITNNASYVTTMNEFIAHWEECNAVLPPGTPLLARLPDNTTRSLDQFTTLRTTLMTRQNAVQAALTNQSIAWAGIGRRKNDLLASLNLFISELDAYFQNTEIYPTRPYVPTFAAGQESFMQPLNLAICCWTEVNAGEAPQGVTLPLVLSDGTTLETFTTAVEELAAAYMNEQRKGYKVSLARAKRNATQDVAYAVMKAYREAVPAKLKAFPEVIDTLPRLTPLPGHTPAPVQASAVFQAPNAAKVVYNASSEPTLARYELRGTAGEHYDEEDAVVIASDAPNEAREFITPFGLDQPGAEIALKVFVVLDTGNEAGSATMLVQRPASVELLAA